MISMRPRGGSRVAETLVDIFWNSFLKIERSRRRLAVSRKVQSGDATCVTLSGRWHCVAAPSGNYLVAFPDSYLHCRAHFSRDATNDYHLLALVVGGSSTRPGAANAYPYWMTASSPAGTAPKNHKETT